MSAQPEPVDQQELATTQAPAQEAKVPISGNGKGNGFHPPFTSETSRAFSAKAVAARKAQAAQARSLKEHLLSILRTGDNAQRLALAWYNKARKGDTRALGLLLERVWPVPRSHDQAGAGKIVHLGIRLEQAGQTTTLVLGSPTQEPARDEDCSAMRQSSPSSDHRTDEIPSSLDPLHPHNQPLS